MTHEADQDARRYLASLPDPQVPAGLADRIASARARRLRLRTGGVAAAMLAALGFALVVPGAFDAGGGSVPREAVAPIHPLPGDDGDRLQTVHAIDRALQAAYDRNAGDDEIEPLWRARAVLVEHAPTGGREQRG